MPIRPRRDRKPHLELSDFGLTNADLKKSFKVGKELGLGEATLEQIIDRLKAVYCGNIGFEYHHIQDRNKRRWLRERIEKINADGSYGLGIEKKKQILRKLNGAVIFEQFLGKKYIAQKRFSLEGGETAIAAIDAIINKGAESKVEEVIIGMAHRGRLNVLANIMGKTYEHIFNEFEGTAIPDLSFGDGDVKYHLGYSSHVDTPSGNKVHLKLVPNPSHLESVDPVVEGFARAKADILYGSEYDKILPILIHGDAAVVGQGVVYETVQMSQLDGYHTGGTLHFVINNQVGFTTDFDDARSSTYCTAAANTVQAPVFHVNGDDPEAVVFAAELAMEYRQEFNNDVFIDMVCYRKHGHNEGDDPKFTQPEMYALINKHEDPRKLYVDRLVSKGDVAKDLAETMEKEFWADLQDRLDGVKEKPLDYEYQQPEQAWRKLQKQTTEKDYESSPETGIDKKTIEKVLAHLLKTPENFKFVSKINRLLKGTKKLVDAGTLDWALAELLAYSSILLDGGDVRMSGQDVRRGTFSHRHAVFFEDGTDKTYNRIQYITAAESKWQRMSGLVLLLPHGMEGQGPEHSSARLERFLQSCAENNITVANCSTAANFFHILRRQLARPFRKPLVLMSPKSGLRSVDYVSEVKDFLPGTKFQEVLDDATIKARGAAKVKRVLLCTGKVSHDLIKYKAEHKRDDVNAEVVWVQEESANMGAWQHMLSNWFDKQPMRLVSRKATASPATGFKKVHEMQQKMVVETAFKK